MDSIRGPNVDRVFVWAGTCLQVRTKFPFQLLSLGPEITWIRFSSSNSSRFNPNPKTNPHLLTGCPISPHTSPSILLVTVDNRPQAQAYMGLRMIWLGIYWHRGRGPESTSFWKILKFRLLIFCRASALLRLPSLSPMVPFRLGCAYRWMMKS